MIYLDNGGNHPMIYLDNGATTLHKPPSVSDAVRRALFTCGNPGRGGHRAAMAAANTVYRCREQAAKLFSCQPEQVAFTGSCTHGLNIAIRSLVEPGDPVVISGFEHNAVTRPLYALGAKALVAGRKLFDPEDTLYDFEKALKSGVKAAIFTHTSNVFGYALPVEEMAQLCRSYHVPFVLDAAQGAGVSEISLQQLGAAFIAAPGHKGLLGPQGTGLLICGEKPKPLIFGGTGSASRQQQMPEELPDAIEAGTLNVPGIAGLEAGISYILKTDPKKIWEKERKQTKNCTNRLKELGFQVFSGPYQGGTVSFLPGYDCEEFAAYLAERDIAVRAGLHCAPLAHESAGTLESGTVRVSFGHDCAPWQVEAFLDGIKWVLHKKYLQ